MNRDNRFLRKEYIKNLFPLMFSVLGGTINALIDTALVSRRLGDDGLAAVNMTMPLYLILCTFGALLSGGASTLSAQEAGEDRMEQARDVYHSALLLSAAAGILITVAGTILIRPVAALLAQNGDLTGYVYQYGIVTMLGSLPYILVYMPLRYLHLDGKLRAISVTMIMMIVVDFTLDLLLMYVFDLGLYGASIASVVSTTAACAFGFAMLERGYSNYHFSFRKLRFQRTLEILRLGSTAAVGNFVDAAKLLLLNSIILKAGGTAGAAVWAVLNSLAEFGMTITTGVPKAASPMISAYFTSKENSGIRILMRLQKETGLVLAGLYAVLLVVLHGVIETVFSVENSMILPLLCLGVYGMLDLLCSIWITFFTSAGRVLLSNTLMSLRRLVLPVAFAGGLYLSEMYLWAFLPLSALMTLMLGFILTGIIRQRSECRYPLSRILLLDDSLEIEHKVIDFSIVPETENICNASDQIKDFCTSNAMNSRQTMRLGLAIEELLTVIAKRNTDCQSVDLRAYALESVTGIRIRYAGKRYDPFSDEEDADFLLGINMIQKLAEVVVYNYSMGMNIINILFEKKENEIKTAVSGGKNHHAAG